MKKSVYITGIVCLIVILFAIIFKATHMAGAAVLLTVGLSSITFIFLPIAYFRLLKSTDDGLLKFVYTAAFISFAIDFIGMLFKILTWPGAGIFLTVGIPLPFVLFLPAYIVYHNKRKLKSNLNFFGVILFMIYLGVFSSLLAMDPNKSTYEAFAFSTNAIEDSNQYMGLEIEVNKDLEFNVTGKQLIKQLEVLKRELIVEANPDDARIIQSDGALDYTKVSAKGNLTSLHSLNSQSFIEFNKQFEAFCDMFKKKGANNNVNRLIEEINVYRLPKYEGDIPVIGQLQLITALNVLTDWQNKILLISYMISASV